MSQAQVAYIGASAVDSSLAQVSYIGAFATFVDADAGPDVTVRPGDSIPLIPAGQTGTFTQVSGTTVTIVGTPPLQSYVAPASLTGATLVFRLTVTDGSQTDTDDVIHTVRPHQRWQVVGGVLRPIWLVLDPPRSGRPPLLLDSGILLDSGFRLRV